MRSTRLWLGVAMVMGLVGMGVGTPAMAMESQRGSTGGDEFGVQVRLGMSLDHAPGSPRFYGLGGQGEITATYGARAAFGVRAESIGMVGFGVGDEFSLGARGLGGILAKGEWVALNPGTSLSRIRQDRLQLVVGLSTGFYRIGTVRGDVDRGKSQERHERVSAMAVGGRHFAVVPQVGLQRDRIRVSLLSHLLLRSGTATEPIVGLELSLRLL